MTRIWAENGTVRIHPAAYDPSSGSLLLDGKPPQTAELSIEQAEGLDIEHPDLASSIKAARRQASPSLWARLRRAGVRG